MSADRIAQARAAICRTRGAVERAGRCTWDSLDGNAEGYVHGGAA